MTKLSIFYIIICCVLFNVSFSFAQEDELIIQEGELITQEGELIIQDPIFTANEDVDPLSPARAAFYSAIVPGLGQAYNKKYWKIPVIYAALGASVYFYTFNNEQYNRYREAYRLLEAGKPYEFDGENGNAFLNREAITRAQERYKEDRDLSLLATFGIYVLQIVEASVNAHLMQLNTMDNITFNPTITIDPMTNKTVTGLSIAFSF